MSASQDQGLRPEPFPPIDAAAAAALAGAFAAVRERIDGATRRSGRAPGSVRLLAVTKTFGPGVVAAAAALGQRAFGENYVQEALEKMEALRPDPRSADLEWHFIGPIQSNKTRRIAERFAWVQSLDREAIARRLSEQRPPGLAPLQVLLEVNISAEQSKSGVPPEALPLLAERVADLPGLRLRGLMAIPQPGLAPGELQRAFARMHALLEVLQRQEPGADTLSMGMSGDFETAIAEGATMVRVGSALFGERK